MNKYPTQPFQQNQQFQPYPPQQQQPNSKKRFNVIAMIGLGLILLSICLFMVSPQISIYAWIFGMTFSFAGLFIKPRWMAVIGTIISSIPLFFILLIVLIINNPGPPSAEQLQQSEELLDEEVVEIDSLALEPLEVDELISNDSTP